MTETALETSSCVACHSFMLWMFPLLSHVSRIRRPREFRRLLPHGFMQAKKGANGTPERCVFGSCFMDLRNATPSCLTRHEIARMYCGPGASGEPWRAHKRPPTPSRTKGAEKRPSRSHVSRSRSVLSEAHQIASPMLCPPQYLAGFASSLRTGGLPRRLTQAFSGNCIVSSVPA